MKSSNIQPLALILIFFNLFHGCVAALNCSSPSPESLFKELEDQLFRKNLIPPVANFSEPLRITLSITVVGILGVDEKAQTLTTFLWQVLEWNIPGLSWDEQKCGTERVSVLREKLWVPDVHISEFMDENKSPQTPYVYLNNTGHVYDDKPIRVVSSCKLEIYNFPFDIQYCTLTFGSYLHFASEIQMLPGRTGEETLSGSKGVLETNGAWELSEIKVFPSELELDVGSYSELKFQLVLRRRPILYVVNLLVPSCFLVTVDLISFLLPPQSVDRASFKMTLILGYTVFLLIMNDLLPVTGGRTPLINPTANTNSVTISGNQDISKEPQPVKASTSPAAPPEPALEELKKLTRHLSAIRLQVDKHFQGSRTAEEWQMIGIVIDRLLFYLYIVFIIASFITITGIWIWNNTYAP
ncbi:5-hydroxytryptamine receptor 3C-like isoform X2 [Gambusia affinis]|uniref:5-hydroxytryptamine receptor 3C-like isoform X2 n=1 Tax=Gambusia affinis TaxID=33528 RepID=UPI001CDD0B13|nr:5-hydroxytryptamine receptor 3C-like isoform X2 [Gambusia affinis]